MRISYFREFIVLAKYLNFSLAAERLHMTQPGLSRHISILEKEVGVKLFERDTHNVKLSSGGNAFLEGIKKIIDDYDRLCRELMASLSNQLHIGIPYFGVNRYLSRIVPEFESEYPQARLNYFPAYPETIIDNLLVRRLDIGILPNIHFSDSERLAFHDAFKESVVIALHREHPLACREGLFLLDLKDEVFLTIPGNYSTAMFEHHYRFCRKKGFEPRTIMDVNTIEAGLLRMKPDMGVMVLPGHVSDSNISQDIRYLKIMDPECYYTISLCHNIENQNPLVDSFIRFYLTNFENQ